MPKPDDLEQAQILVGYRKLSLDPGQRRAFFAFDDEVIRGHGMGRDLVQPDWPPLSDAEASAVLDRFERSAGSAAYQIAKGGLNTLIQVAAAELAGTPITANALLPDTLDTPASRKAMPDARRVPLASVAETIVFLLSEEAANVNGALIPLPA